jgi:hypothetical protein
LLTEEQRKRDLSGEYALVSKHYYYFGDRPVRLPAQLSPIIHATQGHKSDANQPHAQLFVHWIKARGYQENKLYGEPQIKPENSRTSTPENRRSVCETEQFLHISTLNIAGDTIGQPAGIQTIPGKDLYDHGSCYFNYPRRPDRPI